RVADREHDLADGQIIRAAEPDRRKIVEVDAQQGELGIGIRTDDDRRRDPAVRELDAYLVGALDHMPVRDDITFGADHDAGAESTIADGDAGGTARRVEPRARKTSLGIDVRHGR